MHTMWRGSISFGLVNVPVKMYAATENHDVKFRSLHADCGTPMKYMRFCTSCNREIEWKELVKGYEVQPNRFVVMTPDELQALAPVKSRSISILDFVKLRDIDPIYFQKTYYLTPDETGTKAYTLLRKAMDETGRIAVAKIVMRETESLAVIRSYQNYLVMETIFYPDEVREVAGLPQLSETDVTGAEMDMATLLIDNLTTAFDPDKYLDEYRERILTAISNKSAGEEIQTPVEHETAQIADLMQALQASLDLAKQTDKEKVFPPLKPVENVVGLSPSSAAIEKQVEKRGTRRRKQTK
ncbi:MAG: Ku protein [Bacilli bacterium]|nr:Ku protein [Bacilli bacterium]